MLERASSFYTRWFYIVSYRVTCTQPFYAHATVRTQSVRLTQCTILNNLHIMQYEYTRDMQYPHTSGSRDSRRILSTIFVSVADPPRDIAVYFKILDVPDHELLRNHNRPFSPLSPSCLYYYYYLIFFHPFFSFISPVISYYVIRFSYTKSTSSIHHPL